jgi:D-3-phosphoglycerate dehydrogenase
MILSSPNLKIIAMHGVGLSHIDRETAREKGVIVKAVPGGNSEAVADHTWGLLLAAARKICQADAEVREGGWGKHFGSSVNQKTLGIIGFGFIGKAVARRAIGFDMRVLAFDVYQDEEAARDLNTRYVELDDLISTSDYITIHVPLLPETRHLIDTPQLESMKPSAVLVNISRGEVVNERALAEALLQGKIAGAGLDVFSEEPLPEDHPLRTAPNTVLTPHDGARTFETIRDIGIACAENIISALK